MDKDIVAATNRDVQNWRNSAAERLLYGSLCLPCVRSNAGAPQSGRRERLNDSVILSCPWQKELKGGPTKRKRSLSILQQSFPPVEAVIGPMSQGEDGRVHELPHPRLAHLFTGTKTQVRDLEEWTDLILLDIITSLYKCFLVIILIAYYLLPIILVYVERFNHFFQ